MKAACRKSPNTATPQSSNALRSATGQVLLLPHRSTDDRFTPISRLFLKLIGSPEKCQKPTFPLFRQSGVTSRVPSDRRDRRAQHH